MKTGERKIINCVRSAFRDGQQVVNRETNILPTLVGMAILAKISGAGANLLLEFQ